MITRRQVLGATLAGAALAAGAALNARPRHIPHGLALRRFPNVVLWTHDGREVRFDEDLVRGKVVAINMMYVRCDGICPRMTTNLVAVQAALGARLGREVFMYSLTLKPDEDTPEALARYVARHAPRPAWPFLTGDPADVERVRQSLGFKDSDPEVDADKRQHTGMVRIGNDRLGRWTMAPALARPRLIADTILRIRSVRA